MFPVLQVGPLALRTPVLFLLAGVFLGLSLAERHAARRGVDPARLYPLVLVVLLAGVLGARLSYAAGQAAAFRSAPLSLLSLDSGLLDPWGGLAAGLLAALVYGQRKRLPFWSTLDALTPALAVSAIAVGLAHLAAGSAFGAPVSLPWSVLLWGVRRHPSQVYEILSALAILGLLWPRFRREARPGELFLLFIAISAGARLFLETFRGDSLPVFGGMRLAQIVAWLVLAAALWVFEARRGTADKAAGAE